MNVPGEGFHLPSGILHAPGTALTMELQESSDIMAVYQAKIGDLPVPKELLLRQIPEEDAKRDGEMAALKIIDWEACADPYFYENHHVVPVMIEESRTEGGFEEWIYYNTTKFSGKRLTLKPGASYVKKEKGVYNIFVWKGSAKVDGHDVQAGDFGLDYCRDELLVTRDKAVEGFTIENTGKEDLTLFSYFGPDINTDVPMLKTYKK
jgi:mannose-6-phosphate isomerase class I